ncbi:MAG: F0F1 ATP synthase subunit A [Alphaproteobacteria bacterium]|nr:F0F1 ATP synthase subunit A [Alphaproteobacteria bacterium]
MADPMHQFQIATLIPFHVGGVDLSFTNSSLWMLIGAVLSIVGLTIASERKAMIPGRIQVAAEGLYNFVENLISENIGSKGGTAKQYFPLVFTLFVMVLVGNFLGMVPYSFTYTSHLAVTAGLALMVFFTVLIIGIVRHGTHFFSLFVPPGVPMWLLWLVVLIEIVSFISRPITLSVRLFANMVAGHVLMKVIAGFAIMFASVGGIAWLGTLLPIAFNIVMIGFEFFIAFIQAYVFAVLTCIYLKDTMEIEH